MASKAHVRNRERRSIYNDKRAERFQVELNSKCSRKIRVPSRRAVRSWMRREPADYETATQLAESAAAHFNFSHGGGPLDDPDHWVWDLAADEHTRMMLAHNCEI